MRQVSRIHLGRQAIYSALRDLAPSMSPATIGALYGTTLYAVNIGAIAPLLGITEGEVQAGPRKAGGALGDSRPAGGRQRRCGRPLERHRWPTVSGTHAMANHAVRRFKAWGAPALTLPGTHAKREAR